MLQGQRGAMPLVLALTLLQGPASRVALTETAPQPVDFSAALAREAHSTASGERTATELAAKLLLLEELVSLENDVIETKKKRSFPGFGSPLDRLSSGSVDLKGKPRKVVELPKRRFGIPLDRIGANRLTNTRG